MTAEQTSGGFWRSRWLLAAGLFAALGIASLTGITQNLDHWFYDNLIIQDGLPSASDLAVVAVDEKSLKAIGRWPWGRQVHAALIDRLRRMGVKVIALDILFPEPAARKSEDDALARAMRQQGKVILPVHLFPPSVGRPLREYLPIPKLTAASAALGQVQVPLDSDSVARGLYLRQGLGSAVWPSLAAAAAKLAHPAIRLPSPRLVASPFVNVRQDFIRIPFASGADPIPVYSYIDVLDGGVPSRALKGKVVFVGATAAGLGDHIPTPVSADAAPMSGVMFHANAYSALVQRAIIGIVGPWASYGLALIILVTLVLTLPRLPTGQTFLFCGALALAYAGLVALILFHLNAWLAPFPGILTAFLAWPLWNTQRLFQLGGFLNQQIDLLGHATRRSPFVNLPRAEQLLERLRLILSPAGWCLLRNGTPVQVQAMLPESAPDLFADDGIWHHIAEQSWLTITRGGHRFVIGLRWSAPHPPARDYLDRLDLSGAPLPELARNTGERLSARIAQARQASQSLAQLHNFVEAGFDQMADGVVVLDALGIIRFANRNVAVWLDQPLVSLEGVSLDRMLNALMPRPDHPWEETLADTLVQGHSRALQLRLGNRDLLLRLAPFSLSDTGLRGAIASFADITSLCDQQRQQRQAIDFISHDVRSPLVSQLALIAQLKRNPDAIEEGQLDQLARLARRSYQLAEEFVQLARAEQLSSVRFYECEALSIVENAVDAVREQALAKKVTLRLDGEEELWLSGNAELLERAIINLLTNAVQYSPSGTTVTVSLNRADGNIRISIVDQGAGIEPDELPHLFERFRRQRKNELAGQHGTGLGLAFVKVVVDKHQGTIDVQSTRNSGTQFSILLPIDDQH